MIDELNKLVKEKFPDEYIMGCSMKDILRNHNISFKDVILWFKEKNIPLKLTEKDRKMYLDVLKNAEEREKINEHVDSIDDVILFHRTDYLPRNNTVYTRTDTQYQSIVQIKIGPKTYTTSMKTHRDTCHFSANHEVRSHGNGSWKGKKYIVMVPLVSTDTSKIGSGKLVDLYFRGSVVLERDGIILCPIAEMDDVQKKNPHMTVIGYEGNDSYLYGESLLYMLGYPTFYSANEWGLDNTEESNHYYKVLEQYGINTFTSHYKSIDKAKEFFQATVDSIIAIIKIVQDNEELRTMDIEELIYLIDYQLYHINEKMPEGYFSNTMKNLFFYNDTQSKEFNDECYEFFLSELREIGINLTDKEIDRLLSENWNDIGKNIILIATGRPLPTKNKNSSL